jgi:hypothetical protein
MTEPVLVLETIISHQHLLKVLRLFKQRKHAKMGYFFEYEDRGPVWKIAIARPDLYNDEKGVDKMHDDYSHALHGNKSPEGGILRVYRELPIQAPVPPQAPQEPEIINVNQAEWEVSFLRISQYLLRIEESDGVPVN